MFFLKKKKKLSDLDISFSLADIRQRSRILLVDDERPVLIDHLQANHYSIDYEPDLKPEQTHRVNENYYDLIILDFGDIGKGFGPNEGLDILRFLKRCYPRTT